MSTEEAKKYLEDKESLKKVPLNEFRVITDCYREGEGEDAGLNLIKWMRDNKWETPGTSSLYSHPIYMVLVLIYTSNMLNVLPIQAKYSNILTASTASQLDIYFSGMLEMHPKSSKKPTKKGKGKEEEDEEEEEEEEEAEEDKEVQKKHKEEEMEVEEKPKKKPVSKKNKTSDTEEDVSKTNKVNKKNKKEEEQVNTTTTTSKSEELVKEEEEIIYSDVVCKVTYSEVGIVGNVIEIKVTLSHKTINVDNLYDKVKLRLICEETEVPLSSWKSSSSTAFFKLKCNKIGTKQFQVFICDKEAKGSPFKCKIIAGEICADECFIMDTIPSSITSGSLFSICLQSCDKFGNNITEITEEDSKNFSVDFTHEQQKKIKGNISSLEDGKYSVKCKEQLKEGLYTVDIKYQDSHIKDSPFQVKVISEGPNASNCQLDLLKSSTSVSLGKVNSAIVALYSSTNIPIKNQDYATRISAYLEGSPISVADKIINLITTFVQYNVYDDNYSIYYFLPCVGEYKVTNPSILILIIY